MTAHGRRNIAWMLAAWMAAAAPSARAADQPARSLLIISKTDHMLEVRRPDTFALVTRIPIGPDPHEIVVAPDGRTAWISNPGYGSLHEIDAIDLAAAKPLPAIDTAPLLGPHGLAYADGKLWFTAQGSKAVGRYDVRAQAVDWAMGTGQDTTHMLHLDSRLRQLYTTNVGSGTVSILKEQMVAPALPPTGVMPAGARPRLDWVQTLVPVGKGAEGFDVAPDGKELWTVTPDGRIAIVDTLTKALAVTIDSGMAGAHRLAFTPDGSHVLVVSVKTGAVHVYDAARRTLERSFETGRGAGIFVDAAGNRAFISCTPDNFVAVIDLATFKETARIAVGRPDGIAIALRQP